MESNYDSGVSYRCHFENCNKYNAPNTVYCAEHRDSENAKRDALWEFCTHAQRCENCSKYDGIEKNYDSMCEIGRELYLKWTPELKEALEKLTEKSEPVASSFPTELF